MEINSALWQNATTGVKTGWDYPFLPFQKTLKLDKSGKFTSKEETFISSADHTDRL